VTLKCGESDSCGCDCQHGNISHDPDLCTIPGIRLSPGRSTGRDRRRCLRIARYCRHVSGLRLGFSEAASRCAAVITSKAAVRRMVNLASPRRNETFSVVR
jgi:hypothetical protein